MNDKLRTALVYILDIYLAECRIGRGLQNSVPRNKYGHSQLEDHYALVCCDTEIVLDLIGFPKDNTGRYDLSEDDGTLPEGAFCRDWLTGIIVDSEDDPTMTGERLFELLIKEYEKWSCQ